MYNKVLVPLDGSQFSQCSLDHVRMIGLECHILEIVILRVVEPLSSIDTSGLEQAGGDSGALLVSMNEAEATDYVASITRRLNEEGLSVKGEVLRGKADEVIIDYARKNRIDLIIMSSHGRSGISRWLTGSVAERVMRYSMVPVLLVPTPGCRIAQGF